MEDVLVSVVIPCHNVEEYIEECIESIINQTYKNLQIILIDDGSKDSTFDIIKKWLMTDSRIEYYYQENKGVSAARNLGNSKIKGDYFSYVDSDDSIEEDYIEVLLNKIVETGADFVCCSQYFEKDENGQKNKELKAIDGELICCDPEKVFKKIYSSFLFKDMAIKATSKLYKKELLRLFVFPEGKTNEDAWISIDVFTKCKRMVFIPNCLYFYRINHDSIMHTINISLIESQIEWMQKHCAYWKEVGNEELIGLVSREICHYIYNHWEYINNNKKGKFRTIFKEHRHNIIMNRYLKMKVRMKYLLIIHPNLGIYFFGTNR